MSETVTCSREGCGHQKLQHDPAAGLHPCLASGCVCESWLLPPCADLDCQHSPDKHETLAPHACTSDGCPCVAYSFSEGHESSTYEGGGGGFGGGGASGGW